MMIRRLFIAACVVLVIRYPAHAQVSADTSSANSAPVGLEEIVVTAQRRSENLQTVPIAITAVTSTALEQAGINDMLALQTVVPGFTLTDDAGYSHMFLRGIGTTTTGAAYEPSVATYIDGVYIGSQVGNMLSFNNIAQVEVLKGPQGTLFGRNATGGVVNIITRTPSMTPSIDASVDYANYSTLEGKLYVTGGILPNLAADFAAYYRHQQDGWGYDPVTKRDIYKTDNQSFRSKWVYTPTDDTRLTFTWDHSQNLTDVGQNLHFLPGALGLDGATTYAGFFTSFAQNEDYVKTSSSDVSIKVEQDLHFARVVSITAFRDSKFGTRFDQDATPLNVVDAFWTQPTTALSEELQLLSPTDSKIQWIGGMFFLNQRVAFPFNLEGLAAAPFSDLSVDFSNKLKSFAGFGQATAEIISDTHLTMGLRYTSDHHQANGSTYGDGALVLSDSPSINFDKLTWRFALDHQFTSDLLGYVSYNRGFKGGAFNQLTYYLPAVKPEVVDAYEIGTKSEFFDHRVRFNSAIYDYQYKNIQVQVLPSGTQEVINGAAAKIYGWDGDVAVSVTRNLSIDAGASWIHGRYTDFKNAPSFVPTGVGGNTEINVDATGTQTVHTPEYSADLAVSYKSSLPFGDLTYSLTYAYSNGYYVDPDNRLRQPVTNIVNPAITWNDKSKTWTVRAWAANVFNARYYQFLAAQGTGDVGTPAAPVTYGVTFGVHY